MVYQLRKQYEERYVNYLKKRYGEKRANLFLQQSP